MEAAAAREERVGFRPEGRYRRLLRGECPKVVEAEAVQQPHLHPDNLTPPTSLRQLPSALRLGLVQTEHGICVLKIVLWQTMLACCTQPVHALA